MADYAVIMAGGSGTRFWPLSRKNTPKQLLPLGPVTTSLLEATVSRIEPLVPVERVIVVTASHLVDATAAALPSLPRANILAEPMGRNTAPCVGWAAAYIARNDPNARVMVLPADHYIVDEEGFRSTLARGLEATGASDFVTVGIEPTRPETGYGYIESGEALSDGVLRCVRFVEKPNLARAQEFLSSGGFLWNSGMFFFQVTKVLEEIQTRIPELGDALRRFDEAAARGEEAALVASEYGSLPSVSFDHGIMEAAASVAVVPGSFGWSDLGSWTSAWELAKKDAAQNVLPAGSIAIDAEGCLAQSSSGKMVALVGVQDLVVVETDDAILVMPRQRDQDVRRVVAELKGRDDPRV